MTAFLLIVALLVLFAVVAPVVGADTRESREWHWGERPLCLPSRRTR